MQKEIYIIRGLVSEDYMNFRNRIFRLSETILEQYGPETLKTCLTTRRPPSLSIIPFRKNKIAVMSLTRKAHSPLQVLNQAEGFSGGYLVEEAIPVAYKKNWEDGSPTPGACLLTLFLKKPGLDQETFISRWHEGHTPLSLRLHPLWNYNRNVVKSLIRDDAPWYDGIVEEQFKRSSDLLNPFTFFGPPLKVPKHMHEVWKDTRSFIDMRKIEPYLATEFHFLSPANP